MNATTETIETITRDTRNLLEAGWSDVKIAKHLVTTGSFYDCEIKYDEALVFVGKILDGVNAEIREANREIAREIGAAARRHGLI